MSGITLSASQRSTLLSLRQVGSLFNRTQSRLNTGRKVASVTDDAVSYFRAQSLTDRASQILSRNSVVDQNIQALNVALTATSTIGTLLSQMLGVTEGARSATAEQRKTATVEFLAIARQIAGVVKDATYQGLSLLDSTSASLSTQFSERTAASFTVLGYNLLATQGDQRGLFTSSPGVFNANGDLVFSNLVAIRILNNPPKQTVYTYIQKYQIAGSTGQIQEFQTGNSNFAGSIPAGPNGSQTADAIGSSRPAYKTVYNPVTAGSYQVGGFSALDSAQEQGQDVADYYIYDGANGSALTYEYSDYSYSATYPDEANQIYGIIVKRLDDAIDQIQGISSSLGVNVAILQARSAFANSYASVLTTGSDRLTLADLNDEAANSQALQLRDQLDIQSLAVSGTQNRSILTLLQ